MRGSDPILLSQNEWASLGEKAARGAGYDWGHAEEFGWALAELAAMGVDASSALCDLLAAYEQGTITVPRQIADLGDNADRDPLCPVCAGAALCDLAQTAVHDGHRALGVVHAPVFLLPFAARLSRQLGAAVRVYHGALPVTVDAPMMAQGTLRLELTNCEPFDGVTPPWTRIPIDPMAFDQLKAYGLRTTVPATEQSRTAGAGAGLNDND